MKLLFKVLVVVGVAASALGGACEPAFSQADPLNAYPLEPPNEHLPYKPGRLIAVYVPGGCLEPATGEPETVSSWSWAAKP